jgi:hypothetical protein
MGRPAVGTSCFATEEEAGMGDSAWAGVLMVTLAVLIAAAFIALWVRDKGRADEVADDPERAHTDVRPVTRPGPREGAAQEPPELRRERRH